MGLFKKKDQNIYVHFKIETTPIEMPKDGECIIFKFPKDTPKEIIAEWDRRLVEFQNMDRKFITTTMEVTFFKNPKNGKLEVYDESNIDRGLGEHQGDRQDKDRHQATDKKQKTKDDKSG